MKRKREIVAIRLKNVPADYLDALIARRERSNDGAGRFVYFKRRYRSLRAAHNFLETTAVIEGAKKELLRHFPVSIMAAIEGYLRLVIRDLIDSGSPFVANVRQLGEIRFDMMAVEAIGQSAITLGDFVSHLLPLGSLDAMTKSLTKILGEDFWCRLKSVALPLPLTVGNESITTFEPLSGIVYQEMDRLFAQRNILAHELAPSEEVPAESAKAFLRAGLLFIVTVECLMRTLLPAIPAKVNTEQKSYPTA